jgi:hypothetical protein
MTKHRLSPSKPADREQQYEKLLAAMGIEAADPFSRYPLEQELKEIERCYQVAGKQPDRKLVHRYRAALTKLLTLSKTIGPDFFSNEIQKAGWSRHNPGASDSTLRMLMADHGHELKDLVAVLTAHGSDIDHWLRTSGDAYRKRDVRKLAVEPFLEVLAKHKITTSRKQLPRNRMLDALFDWLGVERKSRPSSAAINAVAKGLRSQR